MNAKLAVLDETLRSYGSVLVAFSGGADSAFLLAAATKSLGGERVVAATAVSPSLPAQELARAREFATSLGVRHETPQTDELARDGYRANDGDRCYFCKAELLETLVPLAEHLGLARVATGTNADDAVAGFRPGIRAARERAAVTPLLDAGLTKKEIREISRAWRLTTWNKPAAACLSSRIAYGVPISSSGLARVERAESALRTLFADAAIPVRDLRVRDLGADVARVEVDRDVVPAVSGRATDVKRVLWTVGFRDVIIDPTGFRSGAMNELLAEPARWR